MTADHSASFPQAPSRWPHFPESNLATLFALKELPVCSGQGMRACAGEQYERGRRWRGLWAGAVKEDFLQEAAFPEWFE